MIDSYYHVSINGVKYRLAEGGEGQHYNLRSEALRPPNSQIIQGESSQKFQIRPDVLQWNLTDWSGGEGFLIFDAAHPNRWFQLNAVRAFEKPGTLQPGFYLRYIEDTGPAEFGPSYVGFPGTVDAIVLQTRAGSNTPTIYQIDLETADLTSLGAITGTGGGPLARIVSDGDTMYFGEGTNELYEKPHSTAAAVLLNGTDLEDEESDWSIAAPPGPVIYVADNESGILWEFSKETGVGTQIDTFSVSGAVDTRLRVVGDKVYMIATHLITGTTIQEIVPDSAAGVGFLRPVGSFPVYHSAFGFFGVGGLLFFPGVTLGNGDGTSLFYIQEDGSFGVVARLRSATDGVGAVITGDFNSEVSFAYFATASDGETAHLQLWELDLVTGSLAIVARGNDTLDGGDVPDAVTVHGQGGVIAPLSIFSRTQFAITSDAISPWHDFGLVDPKILGSIHLHLEPLPADWTVFVDYQIDHSGTFVNAINLTTDNTAFATQTVSTDTSSVDFVALQIRIRMVYTGAGIPTTAPTIRGVEVHAQVAQEQRLWDLLLTMDDDTEPENRQGAQKIVNLRTAKQTGTVVAFDNGYEVREAGTFDSYDVIVDSYVLTLSKPGEGVARVTLREVV
jgi:hypothetical protein